ncbi:hypothetical protein Tco_0581693, partial [Tanacetum coccineum]
MEAEIKTIGFANSETTSTKTRHPELDKSEISKFRNSLNGGDILGIVAFPGPDQISKAASVT